MRDAIYKFFGVAVDKNAPMLDFKLDPKWEMDTILCRNPKPDQRITLNGVLVGWRIEVGRRGDGLGSIRAVNDATPALNAALMQWWKVKDEERAYVSRQRHSDATARMVARDAATANAANREFQIAVDRAGEATQ